MTLDELVSRARKRLTSDEQVKTALIKTEPSGAEITVCSLSADEIEQAYNYSSSENIQEMYMIYISSNEMRDAARELRRSGEIKEDIRVCEMFSPGERKEIVKKILELSGMSGAKVTVVDEGMRLKNS